MSKNTFIKKLLLGGLCALTATAMIGATACKDKTPDGEGEGGHTHNYATTWTNDDPDGHYYKCLNSGHTGDQKDFGTHNIQDGECTVCGYKTSTNPNPGPNPGPGPSEEDPNVTYATEKFAINVNDLSAAADGAEIVAGTGVYSTDGLTVSNNSKTILYKGEELSIGKRLQTNGTGKITTKSLKFEIANDNSVIVLYAISGSAGTERTLFLKDGEDNDIDTQSVGDGNYVNTIVFEVAKAGTYYVGSVSSGINLYHISVWEGGKLKETTVETKEAKTANCEEDGNIAYTKTDFGRYKNGSGAVVTADKLSSPALGHQWTADEVTSANLPTAEAKGKVQLHCGRDATHDYEAELPVLSDEGYTRLTHEEAEELVPAGQCNYAYKIPGTNVTVKFTTVAVAEQGATYTTVYSNDFSGSDTVTLTSGIATETTGGIYANYTDKTADNYVALTTEGANSYLYIYDNETTNTTEGYIRLSETITSGIVKISGKITLTANNSSWTFLQLLNAEGNEFVGLRTPSAGKVGVRLEGGGSVTGSEDFTANTEFDFEISIDFSNKVVSVTIGTKKIDTSTLSLGSKATGLTTIKLATASGKRSVKLGEIKVETKD